MATSFASTTKWTTERSTLSIRRRWRQLSDELTLLVHFAATDSIVRPSDATVSASQAHTTIIQVRQVRRSTGLEHRHYASLSTIIVPIRSCQPDVMYEVGYKLHRRRNAISSKPSLDIGSRGRAERSIVVLIPSFTENSHAIAMIAPIYVTYKYEQLLSTQSWTKDTSVIKVTIQL